MVSENLWNKTAARQEISAFSEDYRAFLTACKTERECVSYMADRLQAGGYQKLSDVIRENRPLASGDKVYADMMGKALLIFQIGKRPVTEGMRILGAHIDSPRLDLKQRPLYEDGELVMLDTHYYGGIKKYQWTALPLALHGVIVKKDGSVVRLSLGDGENDPVLGVSDLLPHLAGKQMEKKARECVEGENLNILAGSCPLEGENKDAVKAGILKLLKEQYSIEEEDFISAEIEAVPAGPARDYGLDRSMIMAYGQDDRVCAYTSFRAMIEMENPEYTSVCLLTDKEEIGSVGATGMHSRFFEDTVAEVMNACGCYSELALRRALRNTKVLSSDVSAAFDPNYPEVMDKNNCAYLGRGPVFNKYTGSRGKSGSNDANAEYIAWLRNILDKGGIGYQTSELGKVDAGGGGTIAYILANLGMEVIDCGVAVLNMHAPFEITSKIDVYETYRAYRVFLRG